MLRHQFHGFLAVSGFVNSLNGHASLAEYPS
jgi:hypothetical protein